MINSDFVRNQPSDAVSLWPHRPIQSRSRRGIRPISMRRRDC